MATAGQQLGGAIGLAVLINLTTAVGAARLTVALAGIAVVIAVGLIVALLIPGRDWAFSGKPGSEAFEPAASNAPDDGF